MGTITPIRSFVPTEQPMLFDHTTEPPSSTVVLSQIEAKSLAGLLRTLCPTHATAPAVHDAVTVALTWLVGPSEVSQ